jgi:hypothetical protein
MFLTYLSSALGWFKTVRIVNTLIHSKIASSKILNTRPAVLLSKLRPDYGMSLSEETTSSSAYYLN